MPTIINSVPALVVPEPTLAASRLESMNACPGFIKDIFERNMAAADDGKRREWLEDLRQDPVIEEATRILDDLRAAPTAQSAFPLPPAAA